MRRFPLKNAPDMNGHKFKPHRIEQSPPTCTQDIKAMLEYPDDEQSERAARLIAFMAGSNARALDHFSAQFRTAMKLAGGFTSGDQFESLIAHVLPVDARIAAQDTLIKVAHVHRALLRAMYKNNELLFKPFVTAGARITADMIMRVDWKTFAPLSPQQANDIAASVGGTRIDIHQRQIFFQELNIMLDKSWVQQSNDMSDGLPDGIYPSKFLDVIAHQVAIHTPGFQVRQYARDVVHNVLGNLNEVMPWLAPVVLERV